MSYQYLDKTTTDIKKGNTPQTDVKMQDGATTQQCRAIFMYRNGQKVYKFDRARYRFGYQSTTPTYQISAAGGDVHIDAPVSEIAHGDHLTDFASHGYSIAPGGSLDIHFSPRPAQQSLTSTYVLTQNDSGLYENIYITQLADVVISRTITITAFEYNNGSDISAAGQTNIVVTRLDVTMVENWESGQTTTTNYTKSTIPQNWTLLYQLSSQSIHIGNDGTLDAIPQLASETSQPTLVVTPTINVTHSDGTTSSNMSTNVYQEANPIVDIDIHATSVSIPNTETEIRLYANGTLRSGSPINDITSRCRWICEDTTNVTIVSRSGQVYAKITENTTTSVRSFTINGSYNGITKNLTIEQAEGSSWGYMRIQFPNGYLSQNDMWMKVEAGVGYAHGTRMTGSDSNRIMFTGGELERWNEFPSSGIKEYHFYTSQSESGNTGYYVRIAYADIQNLKNGTPIFMSAHT